MKLKLNLRTLCLGLTLCAGFALPSASAATCTVNSLTDTGAGSGGVSGSGDLRYCVTQANAAPGADVINVTVVGTVSLLTSLPVITDSLVINGTSQNGFRVDAENRTGVSPFAISAGAGVTVGLSDLTITRGNSNNPNGGGITLSGGATLDLENVTVDNNTTLAENGGGIIVNGSNINIVGSRITNNHMSAPGSAGGGIGFFGGTLTMKGSVVSGNTLPNSTDIGGAGIMLFQVSLARIENSTISGNVNGNYGAGIQNNMSTLRMSNVTVSNNTGGVQAAGVGNVGGNAILRNCTIAGNSVSRFGGGIYNVGNGAVLTLANTIVADNSAGIQGDDVFNFATLTRVGANIVKSPVVNSATVNGSGTITNVNPQLVSLRINGGSIPTQALSLNSPARNAGLNAEALDTQSVPQPLTFDGRGAGFPRVIDSVVDLGAFETPDSNARFTIGGRVSGGARVLPGTVLVLLTDLATGDQRMAVANPFGSYRFTGIQFGAEVRIEVMAKNASFSPQTFVVAAEAGDINFTASP